MEIKCDKITPKLLQAAVAAEHGVPEDSVAVDDVVLKPGSKKGDGFSSDIAAVHFKASFEGKALDKVYIAKYAPEGNRGQMLKLMRTFEQESRAYMWLIPTMQKVRAEKGLKPLAFPRCFYASVDDAILILENAKCLGYEVVEKKPEPLSMTAIKLVLKELAAFHASGYNFIHTYPGGLVALEKEYPLTFSEKFFNDDMGEQMAQSFFDMTVNMFGSCVLVSKKYASEDLASRMAAYQLKVKDVMASFFSTKWKLSHISHGDAWYNNFLYKYPTGNKSDPTDVLMVDLQNTKLGRPGIEIAYFFCSSTSPEQRKAHLGDLLRFYYDEFVEQLTLLGGGCEKICFTFDDFMEDFNECYPFGFIMGCMHAQIHLVNKDSTVNFDMEAFGNEEATNKMLADMEAELLAKAEASPNYRQLVIGLAEEAAERNVI